MQQIAASRTAGFTLLEVLVAMTVLATCFGLLLGLLGDSARKTAATAAYREALMIADSQLELVAGVPDPRQLVTQGEVAGRFRWELAFQPAPGYVDEGFQPRYSPWLATVRVEWDDGPGENSQFQPHAIELTTIRLAGASWR